MTIDHFLTEEELKQEKHLLPLSPKEDELLNKLAIFLVDMATAEIQNNSRCI